MHEENYIPPLTKILSATVLKQAGRWFVSMQVEEDVAQPPSTATSAIRVDLGIKTLATLSDGMIFENPRVLKLEEVGGYPADRLSCILPSNSVLGLVW